MNEYQATVDAYYDFALGKRYDVLGEEETEERLDEIRDEIAGDAIRFAQDYLAKGNHWIITGERQ